MARLARYMALYKSYILLLLLLDGDTVDGATIVGRDPAFIQPVDPREFFTSLYNMRKRKPIFIALMLA